MENNEKKTESNDSSMMVKDILMVCLSRWYWFVLSLAICCGYAFYYVLKTPKIYERSAQLLIKDDYFSGTSGGDVGAQFGGLGFMKAQTNMVNEVEAIKSPTIMNEVVRRLGINVSYSTPGTFHNVTLYGSNLPLIISFPDLGDKGSASLKAEVTPSEIILSDFSGPQGLIEGVKPIKVPKGETDTLSTPLGQIVVKPNPRFSGDPNLTLPISVSLSPVNGVAQGKAGALKALVPQDYSSIINLSYTDNSPERAEDILNTLIDVYNENWIHEKNRISVSTSEFIKERLALIEDELGNVDTDISSFKSSHLVPDIAQASSLYFNRAAAASDEVTGLNNRLSMARYIRSFLSNSANSFNVLPANSGLENLNIEGQIGTYNQTLLQRNNLIENSSTQNPLVIDLDNQLAGMRQAIIQSIDNYIVTLNSAMNAARSSQAHASSQLQANPTQARYLLSVERQQKVKESLYLFLLQKREENELSQAFTAYNTRVITPPHGSSGPIAPSGRNIMMMAVLIGLAIPVGIIALKLSLDSKVRGRKDIENLTVPFIGEIPLGYKRRRGLDRFRKKKDSQKERRVIMVKKDSSNTINEAFRVVRTNLELMTDADNVGGRTIMMTSANAGSGKTFITANLATALALKGKRTVIVDLDLRKASLSTFVNSPAVGVSSYLSGHASLEDILVKNVADNEGVDMIPVGAIPPNPAELLYSQRLRTMLDKLRTEYDFIILDCPPVEIVADAKIINRHVDMTIFVIRAGLLERDMLRHIQEFYDTQRYTNLAVILNGTDISSIAGMHSRYGYGYGYYGYGYGYKYGYGYGYGNDRKRKKKHKK